MRIGIDTGGTFTDCVYLRGHQIHIRKVFSTPQDPSRAILSVLEEILEQRFPEALELTHGTTVGTNTLLERTGARVALLTTAGFEDVLAIGRQNRPSLYNFLVETDPPLVPEEGRLGVRERVGSDGRVVLPLSRHELHAVLRRVRRLRPEAVAICLLFSFANARHERQLEHALKRLGVPLSVSHKILPEFREFERTSTVTVNAYLAPRMGRYLGALDRVIRGRLSGGTELRVMQSSGGVISSAQAAREPVRTILSGPAGGVVGARYVAELAGFDRIITFDMGGTSTDVAAIERELETTGEGRVAGLPLAVPMLDIHSVGAGGGSMARFDRAGSLRVGPESAGADPGPICYGRGVEPTVTDAHLLLGHLDPDWFLGGEMRLDEARTRREFQQVLRRVRPPGLNSVEAFARGILTVANTTMEKAIRVISIERGHDPRDYTLVCFGGAGGLHACELARALSIPRVLVPRFPGALSALGLLRSGVIKDYSRTVMLAVPEGDKRWLAQLEREFRALELRGQIEMKAEGFTRARRRSERSLDLRYVGQGYELTVPFVRDFLAAFHARHRERYGYADPARAVEVVTVRLRFHGLTEKPALARQRAGGSSPGAAEVKRRRVYFGSRALETGFYDREKLRPRNRIGGPAVIVEYSATTLVPPGFVATVDDYGNLVIRA